MPQAVHGLRRRQVGDFEITAPDDSSGSVFVRDFQQDFARVAEIVKMDFSQVLQAAADGRTRQSTAAQRGALARLGDQAAHAVGRLHRRAQRLAARAAADDSRAGVHRQALLPARLGRRLSKPLQRRPSQRLRGARAEVRKPAAADEPTARRVRTRNGMWRMYKLRPDFYPAEKVQVEDDITASVVVPRERVRSLSPEYRNRSVKIVENCEEYLFQRPDDAIHRGFDAQAEADIATPGTFITNFEPLDLTQASALVDHVVEFDRFTEPMKDLLLAFVDTPKTDFVVSSAHPRLVDGKPSKNPRYLQRRPDRVEHRDAYLAEIGTRLDREIPPKKACSRW